VFRDRETCGTLLRASYTDEIHNLESKMSELTAFVNTYVKSKQEDLKNKEESRADKLFLLQKLNEEELELEKKN